MFRETFKYYKRRDPPPDLQAAIDLARPDLDKVRRVSAHVFRGQQENNLGLRPTKDWKIYEFVTIPGLIFIENPFTAEGQRYWIVRALKEYSRGPSKLNLDAHDLLNDNETWWDLCFGGSEKAEALIPKLRWATLGYHHNWDSKHYAEDSKTEIPREMAELTEVLARVTGFRGFKAEAAIVNYYRMNSTLAGHSDHSEVNVEAPLFSISFGQSAVFLVGGITQEDPADALILRSGDVVVMSGNSRLRYHGVPKILPADIAPWEFDEASRNENSARSCEDWSKARTYISGARINMNVRQVLKPGQTSLY